MKDDTKSLRPVLKAGFVILVLAMFALGGTRVGLAQNTLQVPQDFPTIPDAVAAANAGDTIRVGPGRWCGADVTKTLDLVGEGGATIIACPGNAGTPVYKLGFRLSAAASGTTIRHFVFDGRGYSDTDTTPLGEGIRGRPGANNVAVEQNSFLGGGGGITFFGSGWLVSHNVFDGFTIHSPDFGPAPCVGGYGIYSAGGPGTTVMFNKITAAVPNGNFGPCSWDIFVDVPVAGIVITGQDGAVISNNKISIASNSGGDAGAGILASDFGDISKTSTNLVITNNDARNSAFGLIIDRDASNGTGNTVGATIRGNFGVNLINGTSANVRNRSIHTLQECDASGVCP